MPTTHNIAITRGDRWKRRFRLALVAEPAAPGDYLGISVGYTGISQIRTDEDSPAVICEGVLAFGSDATSDYVDVTFVQTETVNLDADAMWDLELTGPDGPYTWLKGAVNVTKDVSK